MHARVSRFAGLPPERIDPILTQFQQEQLPAIEQQPGYKGVVVMVDRGEGKACAITYWETVDDLKATDKLAQQARDSAVEQAGPVREPIVDRFEVLLQQ